MSATHFNADRSRLWKKIADDFRQACLLRREGKGTEATAILEKSLPECIAAWSRVSGLREPERRERLNDLFEVEQKRVDDIWLSQQIILRQMRDILIPSLCLQVAEEVREVMELQMEHVTAALANISQAPSRQYASPASAAGVNSSATIVKLPQLPASERRTIPCFDDLPSIIDELINQDLGESVPGTRGLALV